MNYKKALEEFRSELFKKTGDYRWDKNQKFIAGNPTAELLAYLIKEESNELVQALLQEDLYQIRKETCDLFYVTAQVPAAYNLPVDQDFALIHLNNMEKFKTGFLGPNGKWMKSKDHPKVVLPDLNGQHELDFEI